ncbi:MAG: hypothetical protein C6P37_09245 [Caldibacillus debilis]|uniref:Uncharacterized protein n=1 Tax=Caldibacillus debilis TaxID=301148 RepID=A0A150LHK4_9BACI|nr:hypothetical protein B4135_3164 [Caldibacillus debilis]MBY6273571.1 hypothetical protein [Bacillaceae bacterium]OUM87280.1 MAG: hypothetical protein BAA03_04140 [Caldibacillus debilis]REJ20051.1 MAG: hypothetical protein C6W57_00525 [Caldibacillus debilis]REJ28027.1 MAG: hypothetical protein C6P37_09245 [Caldibacillus debilis]
MHKKGERIRKFRLAGIQQFQETVRPWVPAGSRCFNGIFFFAPDGRPSLFRAGPAILTQGSNQRFFPTPFVGLRIIAQKNFTE